MKRWVVINTAGSGYSQKCSPPLTFFRRFADAEKYLRGKIKKYLKEQSYKTRYYDSIKEFLNHNDLHSFETNEGEFFLEQVAFE